MLSFSHYEPIPSVNRPLLNFFTIICSTFQESLKLRCVEPFFELEIRILGASVLFNPRYSLNLLLDPVPEHCRQLQVSLIKAGFRSQVILTPFLHSLTLYCSPSSLLLDAFSDSYNTHVSSSHLLCRDSVKCWYVMCEITGEFPSINVTRRELALCFSGREETGTKTEVSNPDPHHDL